jgi:hypothetical protein
MTQQHPITPPQWQIDAWQARIETMGADVPSILLEVIQWGREQANADIERERQEAADEELEACVRRQALLYGNRAADELRADRRPKPLSLKDDAMEALLRLAGCSNTFASEDTADVAIIRRALESIPDPS